MTKKYENWAPDNWPVMVEEAGFTLVKSETTGLITDENGSTVSLVTAEAQARFEAMT
jgi:hypothetical protein